MAVHPMGTAYHTQSMPNLGASIMAMITRMLKFTRFCSAEHAVHSHFKTNHAKEKSHKSEISLPSCQSSAAALCPKEQCDQLRGEKFQYNTNEHCKKYHQLIGLHISLHDTFLLPGSNILSRVRGNGISNCYHGHNTD